MPYLSFSRDKRGYESTYVMHTYRRRGSQQSRILYWFRTPPNVKVGRAALDEEAIRAIEHGNPGLSFDWDRMLKERPAIEQQPARSPERRVRARPPASRQERRRAPEAPAATAVQGSVAPSIPVSPPEYEGSAGAEGTVTTSAVETLVGAEGLARLQARYAELLARISDRVADPGRREALRLEAQRLDPDSWVTLDEARANLTTFDTAFGTIRAQVSGGRRSRRGGRRRHGSRRNPDSGGTPQ
jgi:hypothetical protein